MSEYTLTNNLSQKSFGFLNLKDKKILLIVFILFLLLGWFIKENFFKPKGMITIIGEGKVATKPEIVKFTISWTGGGSNAQEALNDENLVFNKLISILESKGIEKKDIQVAYPRIVSSGTGNPNLYQAINAMAVTLKNVDALNEVISLVYQNGALRVDNIAYTTINPSEVEEKAYVEAIKDAQKKAQGIAKNSGKKLGKIVSITLNPETEGTAVSQIGTSQGFNVDSQTQMVRPQQIEILRTVSVVYEIR